MSVAHELKDAVAIVTGAANGVGAGIVRLLLAEGAKHIAILDIDEEAGVSFQNELNSEFGANKSKFYKCDVTSDDELFAVFQSVVGGHGSLDLVVNNAGIMNDAPHMYKKEISVNVTALITSTLKALELMRTDEGGRGGTVINIASVAGLCQASVMPIYWATKAAVIQFSNCIGSLPGGTDTSGRASRPRDAGPKGGKGASRAVCGSTPSCGGDPEPPVERKKRYEVFEHFITSKEDYFERTGVRVLAICLGATDTSLISGDKLGSLDKNVAGENISSMVHEHYVQRLESAAQGVIDAYKRGASGSTWIATRDLSAKDITDNVNRAYEILSEHM